jgi:hypothetical protein
VCGHLAVLGLPWFPVAGAATPDDGAIWRSSVSFAARAATKQVKDRRLRSEFTPARSACRRVAALPRHVWWFALAEAKVAGRFGSQLWNKFLFLPPLEPVTPAGVMDLLEGTVMEFAIYLP